MLVRSESNTSSSRVFASRVLISPVLAAENLRRPNCPSCGSVLLIAEQSGFNVTGRIDHAWSCDDCGKAFVTSIRLRPHAPVR
jgi:transposase-like protein